ncbi:MAG: DNA mismatch repair endonuclease MutL [Polyangiaceae bacterium]
MVERPSSVVKELVENAVDAGARRIQVDVESGGVALVRVADDGSGMPAGDARLAVLRHATSKIRSLDDLRAIQSFGFRGEALPSIASVSRFALRTRVPERDEGTEVRVDGGGEPRVGACGMAPGTTVEVRELFFNVPARRKFLRATGTESAHVTEVMQSLALAQPGITVVLARDGRVVREWPRAEGREERARAVFEGEELAACRGERGAVSVEAYLSRPERARPGATGLSVFVNGRVVRDRQLARAAAQAYGSVLEPGRYPMGVVFIDVPPDLVDVNVHPQKAEVRFADARGTADAVYRVLALDLAAAFGLPPADRRWGGGKPALFEQRPTGALGSWAWSQGGSGGEAGGAAEPASNGGASEDPWALAGERGEAEALGDGRASGAAAALAGMLSFAEPRPAPGSGPGVPASTCAQEGRSSYAALRFVAQVRRTFLVCEADDALYVLDQHAAAERVTFHRLRRSFDARQVAVQNLLFPAVLRVSPAEVALVEEAQAEVARLGLDLRPAGSDTVAVHAIPTLLGRAAPERLARDLIDELARAGGRAFSGAIDLALATMACHGSIRAGDAVAPAEATALLASLDEVDFAGHCPHGRPIVMRIGWNELETRVGRR